MFKQRDAPARQWALLCYGIRRGHRAGSRGASKEGIGR
jgi:hypothetical protein